MKWNMNFAYLAFAFVMILISIWGQIKTWRESAYFLRYQPSPSSPCNHLTILCVIWQIASEIWVMCEISAAMGKCGKTFVHVQTYFWTTMKLFLSLFLWYVIEHMKYTFSRKHNFPLTWIYFILGIYKNRHIFKGMENFFYTQPNVTSKVKGKWGKTSIFKLVHMSWFWFPSAIRLLCNIIFSTEL